MICCMHSMCSGTTTEKVRGTVRARLHQASLTQVWFTLVSMMLLMVQPHQSESDVAPLVSYITQFTYHTKRRRIFGYRTHFATVSQAKLLSLSLWCGQTITPRVIDASLVYIGVYDAIHTRHHAST